MPRAGLDRETVIDAAAALADTEGLDAVTLARLAEGLGVKSPSLYKHVAGLDDVRRALALRGIRETNARLARAAVGRAGDDALFAAGRAYRDFARAHRGLYAASVRAPAADDAELAEAARAVLETVLAVLAGYGLRGDDALHATRGLRAVVHGFASLEALGGFGLPLDLDESFDRLLRAFADGLRRRALEGAD